MIKELNLTKPFFNLTTTYGHFGKKKLPYEKLDRVKIIKDFLKQ